MVFFVLVTVFVVSGGMFILHVRWWTYNQPLRALRDWAAANGFRLYRRGQATVPVPLAGLTLPPPRAHIAVVGRRAALVQLDTPAAGAGTIGQSQVWNVLVRDLEADWPATALRPSTHESSLVDLFGLGALPALLASERFTIFGVDPGAARVLTKSHILALLPKDVGLVLQGRRLVLDFSRRPFDGIELSRMLALAEQLLRHLPAPPRYA